MTAGYGIKGSRNSETVYNSFRNTFQSLADRNSKAILSYRKESKERQNGVVADPECKKKKKKKMSLRTTKTNKMTCAPSKDSGQPGRTFHSGQSR